MLFVTNFFFLFSWKVYSSVADKLNEMWCGVVYSCVFRVVWGAVRRYSFYLLFFFYIFFNLNIFKYLIIFYNSIVGDGGIYFLLFII